jgi:hypothetical protein
MTYRYDILGKGLSVSLNIIQATETRDSCGFTTFNVASAVIEKMEKKTPKGWLEMGWLPNRAVAQEWLSFVEQQEHPVLPLR